MRLIFALLLVSSFCLLPCHAEQRGTAAGALSGLDTIMNDHRHFYSPERLARMATMYGLSGVAANSEVDEEVEAWWGAQVAGPSADSASKSFKMFGEYKYVVPLSLVAVGIGALSTGGNGQISVGTWGSRTTRAMLVGGPATLLMQQVTGGSRPGEKGEASEWAPFSDNNGVSGHSFIGAVPFLTLARMTDNPWAKYPLFGASTLAGLSRINDDAHFASQVILGWYMAFEATSAVAQADSSELSPDVVLEPRPDGGVLEFEWRW